MLPVCHALASAHLSEHNLLFLKMFLILLWFWFASIWHVAAASGLSLRTAVALQFCSCTCLSHWHLSVLSDVSLGYIRVQLYWLIQFSLLLYCQLLCVHFSCYVYVINYYSFFPFFIVRAILLFFDCCLFWSICIASFACCVWVICYWFIIFSCFIACFPFSIFRVILSVSFNTPIICELCIFWWVVAIVLLSESRPPQLYLEVYCHIHG